MLRPQLAEFMRRMEPNSVAILPAAREATRSNDTEYRFRQDSDFYYLTGFKEPDAVAVVAPGKQERYTLFLRPRDTEKATWTGQRAADIAAEAHREAMRAARPGVKEYEIEALIEYIFRRSGANAPAYNTIVGGGANATILHYINNEAELKDGDLLLIDAGAEYEGFASDITRTFPVGGRFTDAQRDIYELVLDCQERCIEMVAPGVTLEEMHERSVEILTDGMVRLGLLRGDVKKLIEEEEYKKFYMHRLSHYLGMDVHDVGLYQRDGSPRPVEAGIVITVEPGLYVAEDAEDIPDKYRGIGVRIEDDVLVTPEGFRVLTSNAPKQTEEIESLMAR